MRVPPLISVVTPSYNQAAFIEDTILSVQNQHYPAIEHVIVDGGSTDGTLNILREYDSQITWISEPDEGQSDALNKGFGLARGDIVGWLNSDEVYFHRNVFSEVAAAFELHPEVGCVFGDLAVLNRENKVLRIKCKPPFRYERLLRGCYAVLTAGSFFRRDVVDKHKVDTSFDITMDYDLFLRIGHDYKILHINGVLAGDKLHGACKRYDRELHYRELKRLKSKHPNLLATDSTLIHPLDRLLFAGLRLKGVWAMLKLYSRDDFAINLSFDSRLRSVFRQLFAGQRQLLKRYA